MAIVLFPLAGWAVAATLWLMLKSRQAKALRARMAEQAAACEKHVKQAQDMEHEFNAVCYSVSHDLRAPLRSVHGFSRIIRRNYKDRLDEEGRQFLEIVETNASRMNQMIEVLLQYSRLARRDLSVSEMDMHLLAEQTVEEVKTRIPDTHVQVDIRPLPKARGDAVLIRQVWFQLIHNAVKFSRSKSGARIHIDGYPEQDRNVYCIRDNGVGFDMQYAGKLFQLFHKLHPVEQFEGLGCGLAMVKRILSRHEGNVWAESKPDAGSTFYFSLARD